MIDAILVGVLTFVLGPLVFFISWRIHEYRTPPLNAVLGDVFLAIFNGYAVYLGLFERSINWYLLIFAVLLTLAYVVWRRQAPHNDFTRPEKGHFTKLGWYHNLFFLVQSIIVFQAIQFQSVVLWLLFILYLFTALWHFFRRVLVEY